jgi:hypothetical protein
MRKSMTWFIGLVITTIVPILAFIHFTRKQPDLTFILSDPFVTPSERAQSAPGWQQLEIRNVGSAEAKHVTVKIDAPLAQYELIPFLQADVHSHSETETSHEFRYESLPPSGILKILMRGKGIAASISQMTIVYSEGPARNALQQTSAWSYASIFLNLLPIVSFLWLIQSIATNSLESDAKYRPWKILERSEPYYVSSASWSELQDTAIDSLIDKSTFFAKRIENLPSYEIIDRPKPPPLTDERWAKLRAKSIVALPKQVQAMCESWLTPSEIASILSAGAPKSISQSDWTVVTEDISGVYATKFIEEAGWKIDVVTALKTELPERLSDRCKKLIKESLSRSYSRQIARSLLYSQSPAEELKEYSLDLLPKDDQLSLIDIANRASLLKLPDVTTSDGATKLLSEPRPSWISEIDFERLSKKAKTTIDESKLSAEARCKVTTLRDILAGFKFPKERPGAISIEDWELLRSLDENIRAAGEKNVADREELLRTKNDVGKLKETVSRQLELIDRILRNPAEIDRIEEYENPFSAGNIKNLRRVAELLQNVQQKAKKNEVSKN